MADHQSVDLVRLEEPERLYDREAVLGRDADSVFPSTSKAAAVAEYATHAGESPHARGVGSV